MTGSPESLLPRLQHASQLDLEDFLRFEIQLDPEHPDITDTIYDGSRFRVTCTLAGKVYGEKFGLDVGFGPPLDLAGPGARRGAALSRPRAHHQLAAGLVADGLAVVPRGPLTQPAIPRPRATLPRCDLSAWRSC